MGCECLHGKHPLMKAAAAPTTLKEGFLFNVEKRMCSLLFML